MNFFQTKIRGKTAVIWEKIIKQIDMKLTLMIYYITSKNQITEVIASQAIKTKKKTKKTKKFNKNHQKNNQIKSSMTFLLIQ